MTEFCTLYLVVRDVEQLGRPLEKVITHYLEIVKPSFEQFTLPVRTCILYLSPPILFSFVHVSNTRIFVSYLRFCFLQVLFCHLSYRISICTVCT